MKSDQEIIQLLFETGHLNHSKGIRCCDYGPDHLNDMKLSHPDVQYAVRSYQDFMIQNLEPLCLKHHLRPAQADGDIGPATRELFEIDRCGCPDYGDAHDHYQPKIGTGNWPGCHDIGNFHAATVYVHESGMPSFLEPVFDEVWKRTVAAYEAIGLRFMRIAAVDANIDFSFVRSSSGWIGLAVVGHGKSCSSQIWCRYLARYQPSNIVGSWTELVMHELGHNCGLNHTRGGIMNPSLIRGLPATWDGDPAKPVLVRYYGGEPIPIGPEGKEYWIEQCMKSNRGREVCVPLIPPQPVDEEEVRA